MVAGAWTTIFLLPIKNICNSRAGVYEVDNFPFVFHQPRLSCTIWFIWWKENRGLWSKDKVLQQWDQTINSKSQRLTPVELKQPWSVIWVDKCWMENKKTRKGKKSFFCSSCSAVPAAKVPPTRPPLHCTGRIIRENSVNNVGETTWQWQLVWLLVTWCSII